MAGTQTIAAIKLANQIVLPTANPDVAATTFNTALNGINVLANDTGTGITLTGLLANPVGGTFTVVGGMINFTPTPGFTGPASVTYEMGSGLIKALGTLTVNVGADLIAPVATTITGVVNGSTNAVAVTPTWTDAAGTTSTATLDGVPYTKGTSISTNGAHALVVTTVKTANGLTSTSTVNFTVDTTLPTVDTLTVTGNIGATLGWTNTRTIALATSGTDNIGVTGWLVTETPTTPLAATIINAQPTTYTIIGARDGIKTIYVWNRDAAGNVSLAKTMNITLDTGAVSIPTLPNWGTGVTSGSTTAGTFTPANASGGAIQSLTVTANNGATVSLPSGFTNFGTAVAISLIAPVNNTGANITVTLTFTTTNLAGTVTVTTQNLVVSPAPFAAPTNVVINGTVVSWTAVAGGVGVAGYTVNNITTGTVDLCGGSTATSCDIV